MPNVAKLQLTALVADNAALNPAQIRNSFADYDSAPTRAEEGIRSAATGAGTDLDLGEYTTMDYVVIQNLDATDTLTVTRLNDAAATVVDKVGPGKPCVITDVDPGTDITVISLGAAAIDFRFMLAGD